MKTHKDYRFITTLHTTSEKLLFSFIEDLGMVVSDGKILSQQRNAELKAEAKKKKNAAKKK